MMSTQARVGHGEIKEGCFKIIRSLLVILLVVALGRFCSREIS